MLLVEGIGVKIPRHPEALTEYTPLRKLTSNEKKKKNMPFMLFLNNASFIMRASATNELLLILSHVARGTTARAAVRGQ